MLQPESGLPNRHVAGGITGRACLGGSTTLDERGVPGSLVGVRRTAPLTRRFDLMIGDLRTDERSGSDVQFSDVRNEGAAMGSLHG